MSRGAVLVIDDDPATLEMVREVLQDEGYDVATAVAGEALYSVEHVRPDVILLDLVMLGMNGMAVCQALRARPESADTPIIVMSAARRLKEIAPTMAVNDWLPKPFDLHQLVAIVDRWAPRR